MATWAERRDAYTMQRRAEAREDQRRNALNQIFAGAYEPGETVTTPMYGPTQTGEALPPVVQQQPGALNMQNALARMYRGGFAPEAMQLEQQMRDSENRRMQLGQRPSAVQVYEYYKSLPDDRSREEMLRTMRGAQYGDVGGVRSEMPVLPGGRVRPLISLEGEVSGQAAIAGGKATASVEGKESGELENALREMEANLPRLEVVAEQLSALGKDATYTKAGQARDVFKREIGLSPGKSAVSRKEYIAKVDNEVLPLLRQTFGAQFTQKEGESLKATLGDPDVSPEEKDAVLRSFIDSKRSQVETQKRKLGRPSNDGQKPRATRKAGEIVQTRNGPMLIQRVNPDGSYEGIPAR